MSSYKCSIDIEFNIYTRGKYPFKNIPICISNPTIDIGIHICCSVRMRSIKRASVVYKSDTFSCACLVSVSSCSCSDYSTCLNTSSIKFYPTLKTETFTLICSVPTSIASTTSFIRSIGITGCC